MSETTQFEFIGDVRRRLFANQDCEWNGVVRDITAQFERNEMVNTGLVLVHLSEFYRARAHWANFKESLERANETLPPVYRAPDICPRSLD